MKNLELEKFGVLELNTEELKNVDGGSWGDALLAWALEKMWDNRQDIIDTHHAISAAYKRHPEALLK